MQMRATLKANDNTKTLQLTKNYVIKKLTHSTVYVLLF